MRCLTAYDLVTPNQLEGKTDVTIRVRDLAAVPVIPRFGLTLTTEQLVMFFLLTANNN